MPKITRLGRFYRLQNQKKSFRTFLDLIRPFSNPKSIKTPSWAFQTFSHYPKIDAGLKHLRFSLIFECFFVKSRWERQTSGNFWGLCGPRIQVAFGPRILSIILVVSFLCAARGFGQLRCADLSLCVSSSWVQRFSVLLWGVTCAVVLWGVTCAVLLGGVTCAVLLWGMTCLSSGFHGFSPWFLPVPLTSCSFYLAVCQVFFFEQSRHVTRLRRHRFAAEWWRGASGGQTPTALWFNICAIGSAHVVGRGTPCARDFGVSATNLPSVFTSSAVRALVFFSVGFLLDDWRVWEI